MRDLVFASAEAGVWALSVLLIPLALWTTAALAAHVALRIARAHAAVCRPVRSALLAALPAVVFAGPLFAGLAPDVFAPTVVVQVHELVLPGLIVGLAPTPTPDARLPLGLAALGVGLGLAALAGVVALARLCVALVRLRRTRLLPAPAGATVRADRILRETGVRHLASVARGEPGTVPYTFGWLRPVVVVPAGLDGEALELTLEHEAAHVRAGDFAAQVAARAVAALFVAHPLVHVLVRALAADRERLADAAVLARWPDRGRAYGGLLVSFAHLPAPRLAVGAASGSVLTQRLAAMARPIPPVRARLLLRSGRLLGALALVTVTLGGFVVTADEPAGTRQFQLVYPTYVVDGTTVESHSAIRMTTEDFRFFYVAVLDYGRFVVSDRPFGGAVQAGRFSDGRLDVRVDGHTFAVRADALVLGDAGDVSVYARFDAAAGPRVGLTSPDLRVVSGITLTLEDLWPLDRATFDRRMTAPPRPPPPPVPARP